MRPNLVTVLVTVLTFFILDVNGVNRKPALHLICAGDRVTPPMTFRNMEQLQHYNYIARKKLELIYAGNCDSCPTSCSLERRPVCGCEEQTKQVRIFTCPCEMSTYNCHYHTNYCVVEESECEEEPKRPPCVDEDYSPVCAGDGTSPTLSFNNTCLLEVYNKKHKTNLTVVYNETCDPCNCTESKKYKPVCAAEGCSKPITFNNTKALQLYNCQYRKALSVLHFGECDDDEEEKEGCDPVTPEPNVTMVCSLMYDPVCAGDGVNMTMTFPNNCSLGLYNYRTGKSLYVVYKGKCDTCNCSCTKEYNPVCAASGCDPPKQFSNPCLLQLHNCQYRTDLQVLYFGECGPPPPPSNCSHSSCVPMYDPVCAGDGVNPPQTFENIRQLDVYNHNHGKSLSVVYKGMCDPCEVTCCTSQYTPICGISPDFSTRHTFNNTCHLNTYNCQYKTEFKPYYNGKCLDTSC